MYEGGSGGAESPAPAFPDLGGGYANRFHLEGLIPLILILIIGFLLLARLGILTNNTPFLGPVIGLISPKEPSQILIIGSPSIELIDTLEKNRDVVRYVIKSENAFIRNAEDQLAQYDLVVFDQSNQANKDASSQLGDGIKNYVKTGGKVIVVMDSGIRRPGAVDILGWQANFGDIVPVTCDRIINDIAVCAQSLTVYGIIWREDFKHPVLEGIERVPAETNFPPLLLQTFDVGIANGKEIAYIEDVRTGVNFPAIVEKTILGGGKVMYFNYNPGFTPGILTNTLKYLLGKTA